MPRGGWPSGPLRIWKPDSREDEKPHQSCQRYLQGIPGSTSQRLSRGWFGKSLMWSRVFSCVSVLYTSCFCFAPLQEMVDIKRFIEKQLPAVSDEWKLECRANRTAPSESFGVDSVDSRNRRLTWQNHAAAHRARRCGGCCTAAQNRHNWSDVALHPELQPHVIVTVTLE